MLLGQFDGKISEKQQISLPSKFRQILGEKIIITKGFEACLIIVSEHEWKTLLEGTEGRPFTNKAAREIQRFLLGNASFVELDHKGRCVLPAYLRDYAGLKNDIVFAGIQRFVEVWNKKAWDEQQENLSEHASLIAERLSGNENVNE
ncbi:MAG TPA: division/cell wall cluster transcriptional repressor MraZ [Patescibacteria group bacterium]|nr:division/cell wall cluster transcriptional repressor MraZ [Patescibacteria group bacterium]